MSVSFERSVACPDNQVCRILGMRHMRSNAERDLQQVLRDVDIRFFKGKLAGLVSEIRWSRRPGVGRWAVWKPAERVIEVNKLLDDPSVPDFVLDYMVFHEGLHATLPNEPHGRHHGRLFTAFESAFPRLQEVREWEQRRAREVLLAPERVGPAMDRYGAKYGLSSADVGVELTTPSGKRARVLGWSRGMVILEDIETGEQFGGAPRAVARRLGRAENPPGDDPEQPDVRFYPVRTGYMEGSSMSPAIAALTPDEYYSLASRQPRRTRDELLSALVESAWYASLQPEYKTYPAIVAALAATRIDIGCEHLRMPFPAFAIRLPEGFVQEPGGPPIRSVFVAMLETGTDTHDGSRPVVSFDSAPIHGLDLPVQVRLGEAGTIAIAIQAKYIDKDGDDAFANYWFPLERGKTIEQQFVAWLKHWESLDPIIRKKVEASGGYFLSDQLARELLSLAVGVSFFATGRLKSERPILQREKRPRHERRRFEKEHDGQEQPTFVVGRELVLPREQGAPAPDGGREPGEGVGRSLKFAHMRCGHLRYQAHGPGFSERTLRFIEPTLVGAGLPLGTKVTPARIIGGRTRDVAEGGR